MTVTTYWDGRVLVAKLVGEIDMKNHESLAANLEEIARLDAAGVVLDFASVAYIASVGIGLLLNLVKEGKGRGMSVRLAGVQPAVRMILEIVCTQGVLPMDENVAESIAHMPVAA